MADGLLGWWVPTSTKLRTKIHQVGDQNRPRWGSKSFKIGARGRLGGVLEPSWPILGPRDPQEPKMLQNVKIGYALLGAIWGPKSIKNRSWGDPKGDHFFWSFWRLIFEAIWCQLGPILDPKTFAKWGQVGSKIDPSWGVDLRAVFEGILVPFL